MPRQSKPTTASTAADALVRILCDLFPCPNLRGIVTAQGPALVFAGHDRRVVATFVIGFSGRSTVTATEADPGAVKLAPSTNDARGLATLAREILLSAVQARAVVRIRGVGYAALDESGTFRLTEDRRELASCDYAAGGWRTVDGLGGTEAARVLACLPSAICPDCGGPATVADSCARSCGA